ncbi:uncharacterized protein LOC108115828 [Drosophila eugracilis]|uniref:uncharacterized protein LOC108115828 n=1 Tax=Drosophila eugracilis TaxID=29029 RepID=UPI0007E794D5|nr:uncharacterized protein LOC108115828 [Drosophila eugracilis]
MFHSLSVLLFNTSEIEANLFGMADDVYNTIEIFKEAARFEDLIVRPYKMISNLIDCLVFMTVALIAVGFIMYDRIVVFAIHAGIFKLSTQKVAVNTKSIQYPRKATNTLPLENDNENSVEPADEDDNSVEVQPNHRLEMVGTPKWAFSWLSGMKIKAIGSVYDYWIR